jgi:hypothetical protein
MLKVAVPWDWALAGALAAHNVISQYWNAAGFG